MFLSFLELLEVVYNALFVYLNNSASFWVCDGVEDEIVIVAALLR